MKDEENGKTGRGRDELKMSREREKICIKLSEGFFLFFLFREISWREKDEGRGEWEEQKGEGKGDEMWRVILF